ncbi:MAG: hypothetical protein AB8H80_08445 [Planctomycetota bacterium]
MLSSCGQDNQQTAPPRADGGASPRGERPERAPPVADLRSIADDQLLEHVLDACHRPLRRRMRNVRATVTLLGSESDAEQAGDHDRKRRPRQYRLQASLPDRARIQIDARTLLLRDRIVTDYETGNEAPAADADRIRAIVRLVDAAAFGPLYRAEACARTGADDASYRLTQPAQNVAGGSEPLTLTLRANTLLPASLTYGEDVIRFDGYLTTVASFVARRVTEPRLGTCRVVFDDGGVSFAKDMFLPRQGTDGERANGGSSSTTRMVVPGAVVESASPTPIVVTQKATRWVVLPDGDSWAERHERYRPVIAELEQQNQRIAGFPILFEPIGIAAKAGSTRLAAPFRQRKNGAAFATPDEWAAKGWLIVEQARGKLLVVYPPEGDVAARIEAGKKMLRRALSNRRLTARGPITAQPFVHLHESIPSAAKLEQSKVRVAVRIE